MTGMHSIITSCSCVIPMNLILHRVDSLICTPKKEQSSSITFKSHNGSWSQQIRPGKQIRPNFLRSTSLLYKILPTSLTCKPAFYTFYTSQLRWNSTMRRCFYHTDLGQNAVFHNYALQIALIQYSGLSKHAWAFSETVKKISKITYTASLFSLSTRAKVDCLN